MGDIDLGREVRGRQGGERAGQPFVGLDGRREGERGSEKRYRKEAVHTEIIGNPRFPIRSLTLQNIAAGQGGLAVKSGRDTARPDAALTHGNCWHCNRP